jgi:hypothetical protein
MLSGDRGTGRKSLSRAVFFAYPQGLWISLWMARGRGALKRMAAPFATFWTCFGHVKKFFHINALKIPSSGHSRSCQTAKDALTA